MPVPPRTNVFSPILRTALRPCEAAPLLRAPCFLSQLLSPSLQTPFDARCPPPSFPGGPERMPRSISRAAARPGLRRVASPAASLQPRSAPSSSCRLLVSSVCVSTYAADGLLPLALTRHRIRRKPASRSRPLFSLRSTLRSGQASPTRLCRGQSTRRAPEAPLRSPPALAAGRHQPDLSRSRARARFSRSPRARR